MRSRIAKGGIAGLGGVLGPVREQDSLKSESESLDTVTSTFKTMILTLCGRQWSQFMEPSVNSGEAF
jgi:hypothetical protein